MTKSRQWLCGAGIVVSLFVGLPTLSLDVKMGKGGGPGKISLVLPEASAATPAWDDGGGADDNWFSKINWDNNDTLPVAGDFVTDADASPIIYDLLQIVQPPPADVGIATFMAITLEPGGTGTGDLR